MDLTRYRKLTSSFAADILDQFGVENSVIQIAPLYPRANAVGPAMPVKVQSKPNAPIGLREGMMNAVDASPKNSILVICSDTTRCSNWGGLTSRYAKLSGIAGVVVFGAVRDTADVEKLRLPVFTSNVTAVSGQKRVEVASIGEPIDCGSVKIAKGDLVVADRDSIVFVPAALSREVLERASRLTARERQAIMDMKKRLRHRATA